MQTATSFAKRQRRARPTPASTCSAATSRAAILPPSRCGPPAYATALPLPLHVPSLTVTFSQPLRRRSRARFSRPSSRRWRVSPTGRDGLCLGDALDKSQLFWLHRETMHSFDTTPMYDFNSVLIKPNYNREFNISSRSQVNLERTFHFKRN